MKIFGKGKKSVGLESSQIVGPLDFETLPRTLSAVPKRNIAIVTPPVSFVIVVVKELVFNNKRTLKFKA